MNHWLSLLMGVAGVSNESPDCGILIIESFFDWHLFFGGDGVVGRKLGMLENHVCDSLVTAVTNGKAGWRCSSALPRYLVEGVRILRPQSRA
jgi:hypothetical protein